MPTVQEAKERLDSIVRKARVDMYKPIQIAEVLRRSRIQKDIQILKQDTYQNPSIHWRNKVTRRLIGKVSTSSANYQHDIWNQKAMPPDLLAVLDHENKRTNGGVEYYIYLRFSERQNTVASVITFIETSLPENFDLSELLIKFTSQSEIRRSVDKAYEIVVYSLFETIVNALETTVKVSIPVKNTNLLAEFSDLTKVLLGLELGSNSWEVPAHIYRVGVTNAADRGLDMWANFGAAIQVKHLTLNQERAQSITNQVESDNVVIVCRDADARVIETIANQISWGSRVRGIVKESELIDWYERCLRGKFSKQLSKALLERLVYGFKSEFPQASTISDFLSERNYSSLPIDEVWTLT
ncbi:HaeII restriction endonuclease [Synechococcus sp. PCC 7502]|uniref:HaeII family restriction endonuclease n=1 Tax=Synechococcus sp. PCC 7502 TaxID=1173263 RepID=UPI00029FB81F|nr:HaeII family restriction endonuclease [Synechococcus sp. PCC 7502]AFY72540.1 HaeII restriction endonuclease [Synechococcus sp. PCC 7502]